MKRTPADIWFSKAVRERANWRCEVCGKWFSPGATRGLDCSHFVDRLNYSVRFDPDNAFAHCMGCHTYLGNNPHEFTEWAKEKLNGKYEDLIARSKDISIGKRARKLIPQIAAYYRKEYGRLVSIKESDPLRLHERIEITNWE